MSPKSDYYLDDVYSVTYLDSRRCQQQTLKVKALDSAHKHRSCCHCHLARGTNNTMTFTLLLISLLFLTSAHAQTTCDDTSGCYPPVFDILEGIASFTDRSYSVSGTCGLDPAATVLYTNVLTSDLTTYTCDPSQNTADKMFDNDNGGSATFWQSPLMVAPEGGDPTPQYAEFRFTDEFIFYEMFVNFYVPNVQDAADSVDARPKKMIIEKLDSTGSWVPLFYMSSDCASKYPDLPVFDPRANSRDYDMLYCQNYEFVGEDPFFNADNEVSYSPGYLYDVSFNYLRDDPAAIAHFTTSGIRLYFEEPASLVQDKSYVMINDIIIDVFCACSGHASQCSGPNGATCECAHNTTGKHCDSCLPLFNDQPWQIGTTTAANACQECDCNSLADSCVYDDTKTHGVCQACQENTAGDRCESCVSGFYVNPAHVNDSSIAYCLTCSCSELGTVSTALDTCDVTTGQCSCKDRVEGRDCSVCQDTFWGISQTNDLGCDVCSCNADGSLGSINLCDKDTGQCLCKTNVEGTTCNVCKPATFNFDAANPYGCTMCDCDPGASSSESCDLTSGQCTCRANIGSRNCSQPNEGFFVPKMDLILLEPEEFTNENLVLRSGAGEVGATVSGRGFVSLSPANQIAITFTSPYSGPMEVAARYEIPNLQTIVLLEGSLDLASGAGYTCNGEDISAGQSWNLIYTNLQESLTGGVQLGTVCLQKDAIYTISISNPSSTFLVDSIFLMPTTAAMDLALAGRLDSIEVGRCVQQAVNNVRVNRGDCGDVEYSAVSAYLDGAQGCQCTSGAVTSTSCEPRGGECYCLPGVLAPDCSQCHVDAYSFSTSTGCIDCDCYPTGSSSDICSANGDCECLTNVQGSKCDVCLAEHYGLSTGEGCTQCQCDPTYSINNNCNDLGECLCKVGVAGPLCQACLDGYYNLTPDGCTQCACNAQGSTESSCDSVAGVCECLDNVEGDTCSTCKTGYFGLGSWHPDGCIPCFCWEHGDVCSSAQGYYSKSTERVWLASNSEALSQAWVAEDSDNTTVLVETPLIGDRYALRVSEASRSTSDIFFLADSSFLGNQASSYGRYLTVTLTRSPPSVSPLPLTSDGDTGYDVIISDIYCSLGYKWNSSVLQEGTETPVEILMTEPAWTVIGCVDPSTFGDPTGGESNSNVVLPTPGTPPRYELFLSIIAAMRELKLRVYTANETDSALDLLGVTLDGAVDGSEVTDHSGILVNNVEECVCLTGYTGESCEMCGKDYTRSTPGFDDSITDCVPCSCNSHGVTECTAEQLLVFPGGDPVSCAAEVTSCDPVYGICTCQHNTVGDHCEECLVGYYGDATRGTENDCLPCGCPGIIVNNDVNVFSNSCSANDLGDPVCTNCTEGHGGDRCEFCVDGYFGSPENATDNGGRCTPCECNDRADTCDTVTGECIACRNNTAGNNCETCAPGYFGDAMNSDCQECSCTELSGSTGNCDHVTGVCECLPNVGGASCDVCDDMFFNLTAGIGCEPCDCYSQGSQSLICDKVSGRCPCVNLVQGRTCRECDPGYWNVNLQTGCDPCTCNSQGTALLDDGTVDPTCEVITGQCNCALPGITGRTCDACLPATANNYTYIDTFYLGTFPNCVLCGECFDSWADKIDIEGGNIATARTAINNIWTHYDDQTEAQVSSALDVIEEQIVQAAASVSAVEDIARQLQDVEDRFSQATVRLAAVSTDITGLTATQTSLQATLTVLAALTEVVEVSSTVSTSVTDLRNDLDDLIREANAQSLQGNSSWQNIERLSFVVAEPADRERQLRQQAEELLSISDRANQNYDLAENIYRSTLDPGVADKAEELALYSQAIADVGTTAQEVTSLINGVQTAIDNTQSAAMTLVAEASEVKDILLKAIEDLQAFVTNTSAAQLAAADALDSAINFKVSAETALATLISSTNSVLANLASLAQAQTDLVNAQTKANNVLSITLPTLEEMDNVITQINQSDVSFQAVEELNLQADQDLFTAEQAVEEAQNALAKARELNQDLILMEEDVQESRDLRSFTVTVSNASDATYQEILSTIEEADAHSTKAELDATNITAEATTLLGDTQTVTLCLDQAEVDVTSSVTSAGQVTARTQTASDAQLDLLNLMQEISVAASDSGVLDELTTMTQANSTLTQMEAGLTELEALVDIAVLVQTIQSQEAQLNALNTEVDTLTSEVDLILVSLQEAQGTDSCDEGR